jgi:hypothetical protein
MVVGLHFTIKYTIFSTAPDHLDEEEDNALYSFHQL